MANFKKILAAVLSAAMVVTFAPVGVATNVQAATKATAGTTTLKVSASKATIKVGKTKKITVTVNKAQSAALKVSLKSSKAAVAKVASKTTIKKGAKKATFVITAKKAGKANITVSYKTSANKTVKKTIKVTVKNSEVNEDDVTVTDGKITITCDDGLQTDGTACVGDTLRVNVDQKLGTIAQIMWYCDGKSMNMTGQTNMNYITLPTAIEGEYYAVAVTSKGTSYKSNTIKVTEAEAAAVLKGFAIEDDYTSAATLGGTFKTTDGNAVITVTLNKNYNGQFKVYKKSDSSYKNPINLLRTDDDNWVKRGTKPTAAAAIAVGDGKGIYYVAADGAVTYSIKTSKGLDRGTEYVVAFDQDSTEADNPSTGKANVFETAVVAPYLEAPEAIAITGVSAGDKPEITVYGKDNKEFKWFGDGSKNLADTGISKVVIYGNSSATTTGGTALQTAEGGKFNEGVYTSNKENSSSASFFYATLTTTKGIFGDKSVTLTSAVKDLAQQSADSMQLTQDGTTPSTAVVAFTNLRTAGKVYIVKGSTTQDANDRLASFKANTNSTYDAVMDVDKGTPKVEIAGVIDTVSTNTKLNTYAAIFVPTDSANYSAIKTVDKLNVNGTVDASKKNHGLEVKQAETTYKVIEDTTGAANAKLDKLYKVVAYDQFGEELKTNMKAKNSLATTPAQASQANTNGPVISISTTGVFTIGDGTTIEKVKGNKYTLKIANTTFTFENTANDGLAPVWKVSAA